MKTLKTTGLTVFAAIAFLAFATPKAALAQPGVRVSFQMFYDQLAPHGEWVDDPDYGYIWLPNVSRDFQPYATNGYWVMTNYGNTWVSNYSWGWAPFHYGRWMYTDYYGWAWVPGYEWGPAWVSWRSGGGYYGWAPLGPRMSININIGIPHHHWVFVPQRYITSPRIYSYYIPHRNRVSIYNRTTIINNTYVYNNRTYVSGPKRADIERATRSRVSVRDIRATSSPGRAKVDNRSVSLYRPEIDRNSRTAARPSRVSQASAVRNAGRTRSDLQSANERSQTSRTTATSASRSRARDEQAAAPRSTASESNNVRRSSRTAEPQSDSRSTVRAARTNRKETVNNPGRNTQPQGRTSQASTSRSVVGASSKTPSRNSEIRASRPATRTQSRPSVSPSRTENRSKVTRSKNNNSRPVERINASSKRGRR